MVCFSQGGQLQIILIHLLLLGVLQIDCGNGRAGVQWDAQEAVDIVRFIKEKCPNLAFQVN